MDISRMARGLGTIVAGVVIGGAILFAQHSRARTALAEGGNSNWDGVSEVGLPADPACAQRFARGSGPHVAPAILDETTEQVTPAATEGASPTAVQME